MPAAPANLCIGGKHLFVYGAVRRFIGVQGAGDKIGCPECKDANIVEVAGCAADTRDKRRSYAAAFRQLGLTCRHEQGLRNNNRARIHTQQCDDVSASCDGSNQLAPPSAP